MKLVGLTTIAVNTPNVITHRFVYAVMRETHKGSPTQVTGPVRMVHTLPFQITSTTGLTAFKNWIAANATLQIIVKTDAGVTLYTGHIFNYIIPNNLPLGSTKLFNTQLEVVDT